MAVPCRPAHKDPASGVSTIRRNAPAIAVGERVPLCRTRDGHIYGLAYARRRGSVVMRQGKVTSSIQLRMSVVRVIEACPHCRVSVPWHGRELIPTLPGLSISTGGGFLFH